MSADTLRDHLFPSESKGFAYLGLVARGTEHGCERQTPSLVTFFVPSEGATYNEKGPAREETSRVPVETEAEEPPDLKFAYNFEVKFMGQRGRYSPGLHNRFFNSFNGRNCRPKEKIIIN